MKQDEPEASGLSMPRGKKVMQNTDRKKLHDRGMSKTQKPTERVINDQNFNNLNKNKVLDYK